MARIRTVKPEMAQDEDLAECSSWAQLLAVRILNHADDEGYFKAHPALIRAACFPLITDDSLSIHGVLTELSNAGYLAFATGSDGKKYGKVLSFSRHQIINRPTASKIKGLCDITEGSVSSHGELTGGKEGKGKEQGKEQGSKEAPRKRGGCASRRKFFELAKDHEAIEEAEDYDQLLTKKKASKSERAWSARVRKLETFASKGQSVKNIIARSADSGWTGLFEEKQNGNRQGPTSAAGRQDAAAARQAAEL